MHVLQADHQLLGLGPALSQMPRPMGMMGEQGPNAILPWLEFGPQQEKKSYIMCCLVRGKRRGPEEATNRKKKGSCFWKVPSLPHKENGTTNGDLQGSPPAPNSILKAVGIEPNVGRPFVVLMGYPPG